VVACLRLVSDGKVTTEVRTFQTTTADLLRLSEWLATNGCTHVAMEATGIYWKPVWHILDDGEFELVLANAAHVKNVPGRKSDVNDATWVTELLAHGLIRPSFVPDAQTQEMRNLLRTRKQLVREQSSHVLRVQKTLEDANIKLDSALTDVMGKSGRAMIEALIAGETNPAKWCHKRCVSRGQMFCRTFVPLCSVATYVLASGGCTVAGPCVRLEEHITDRSLRTQIQLVNADEKFTRHSPQGSRGTTARLAVLEKAQSCVFYQLFKLLEALARHRSAPLLDVGPP
jgi:hypothetical protein